MILSLIEEIRGLPNRDEFIQKQLKVKIAITDGGGVGKFQVINSIKLKLESYKKEIDKILEKDCFLDQFCDCLEYSYPPINKHREDCEWNIMRKQFYKKIKEVFGE